MKKSLIFLLALSLLLAGCGKTPDLDVQPGTQPTQPNTQAQPDATQATQPATVVTPEDPTELFSKRDFDADYSKNKQAVITLQGDTATCASNAVRIDGGIITIIDEGTYILTGTLDAGMIVVNADKAKKVQLVLKDANIHSATSAPIYILQADKVFITLAEGTKNVLSNGGSFASDDENNIDAVIFSKEDVTFNGTGSLTVTSPAGHGIVSKDELTVTDGTYTIISASHGIAGKDNICVAGGSLTVTAGKDGIHAENDEDAASGFVYIGGGTFSIRAEGDGISASSYLQIDGGIFDIVSGGGSENGQKENSGNWGGMGGGMPGGGMPGGGFGGGRPNGGFGGGGRPGGRGETSGTTGTTEESTSMKGLKASGDLILNGGSFTIDSADDAAHANGNLTLCNGTFQIRTGDDGFHADDTLTVTDGMVEIAESYEGLEGLHIWISGGSITLTASDDGLNAAGGTDQSGFGGNRGDMFGGRPGGMGGMGGSSNGSITISGGTVNITASGDGIDANGTLEISDGYIIVCGPTQGDTATLDYDVSGVISGGTFIGTGASGMAQSFSNSAQGVFAVKVGNQTAGTTITLTDSSGKTIISHTPQLSFAVVILSSPDIVKGQAYTITIGESSGTFNAN